MNLARFARASYTLLRDVRIFGPSILLRNINPRDTDGIACIRTWQGRFHLRPADSDMKVLHQVFVEKDYDLDRYPQGARIRAAYDSILKAGKIPVIIDAGANIGAASIWFARMFPDARVIAVEPSPKNAELCRRNCRDLGNVEVVEAAIGSSAGTVNLEKLDGDGWAVQTRRAEGAGVKICTVPDLLRGLGPDFALFIIKIDIEGFERDLFMSNVDWLEEPTAIIVEPHDWMLPGEFSSKPLQKAIFAHNFELLISGENLVFVR